MIKSVGVAVALSLMAVPVARADELPSWMTVDQAKKTVAVDIVAGWNPENSALNFNGYFGADMVLTVPVGWTVKVAFLNHDGMLPHSLLVTKQYPADDIPPEAGVEQVAISKAYSDNPVGGLGPNETDKFGFTARNAGDFWMVCGVPGHALQGMYVDLKIDAAAQMPSIGLAKDAAVGRP